MCHAYRIVDHCSQPFIMPAENRSARICMTFFSSSVSHSGRIYLAKRSSMTSNASAASRTLRFLSHSSKTRFGYKVKSTQSLLMLFIIKKSFLCRRRCDRHVVLIFSIFLKGLKYKALCALLWVMVINFSYFILHLAGVSRYV